MGVDVHAVIPRRTGQSRVEELDGITVHGQSSLEVLAGRSLFREIDADIYHVGEPNLPGYWAQRAMPDRVHLVTSMDPRDAEDWRTEFAHCTWSRRLKYPLQRFYEDGPLVRRAVRSASGVYVEAAFLRDKARTLYGLSEAPGVLPKPVDVPKGPFEKAANPICVSLGRLDPRKNPELFCQLAERMPDVDFVAIGVAHDSVYQRRIEATWGHLENLHFAGFLDPFGDGALQRILSRAWILVHPAHREGLPTAFQEASLHEMAVLAAVDPDQYVSRFGRVVKDGRSVDAFERELRQLLCSGDWRERGRAGRAYNVKVHSLRSSVTRHLEVYSAHLGRSAGCWQKKLASLEGGSDECDKELGREEQE